LYAAYSGYLEEVMLSVKMVEPMNSKVKRMGPAMVKWNKEVWNETQKR
jgi:hypothetical protein